MDKEYIINLVNNFVESSEYNYINKEIAVSEDIVGTKIFDTPVFAFGNADDENFKSLKDPSAVGEHFLLPKEWMPQAKTVITFFLPFTEEVKKSNSSDLNWPSGQWLHGRVEGQMFIKELCKYLKSELINAGYNTLSPLLEGRFWSRTGFRKGSLISPEDAMNKPLYTSNWSERHVAFVCGLGTFGLSKGLITKKGMAGRIGSVITELYIIPDKREYKDIYEYCTMCGSCIKRCPAHAISMDKGKDHIMCAEFLDITAEKFKPRYGCGKCQVKVPCESGIPKKYNL